MARSHAHTDEGLVPEIGLRLERGRVRQPRFAILRCAKLKKPANLAASLQHTFRERETLNAELLVQAIKATFARRGMAVPAELPVGLTDEFADDTSRQGLWNAFAKKNGLAVEPLDVTLIRLRKAFEHVFTGTI